MRTWRSVSRLVSAALRPSSLSSQEYVDYNGGPGVQHIALNTSNIIEAVRLLITDASLSHLRVKTSMLPFIFEPDSEPACQRDGLPFST